MKRAVRSGCWFTATADAKRISRASHFRGQRVPATIRFANASGNPVVHDGLPGVRSMAVKFELPDGKNTDILANSVEGFSVRTPEDLPAFLKAQLPDPGTDKPNPDAMPRFLASHPSAPPFIERLGRKQVPASFAAEV